MLCPACLISGVNTEAVSQVDGTLFCGVHATEALTMPKNARGGAARGQTISFSPVEIVRPVVRYATSTPIVPEQLLAPPVLTEFATPTPELATPVETATPDPETP